MKKAVFFFTLVLSASIFISQSTFAQITINSAASPEEMVENLIGLGVSYSNVTYTGANQASGEFLNGNTTNLGIDVGIFLTSGAGYNIPGPNVTCSATAANGLPGDPLLNTLTTATTYDASVLEFDFIPQNDTIKCMFVFGSEEYNEWVNSPFNDVYGFFVNGPQPDTGNYVDFNIALIPGTDVPIVINSVNNGNASCGTVPTGPCTNCEYYADNTNGLTIGYDGFTVPIEMQIIVVPDETYHFKIAVADAGDGIYDSGVFIEGQSFKSLGAPEFLNFKFLAELNEGLNEDVEGFIEGNDVYLTVPAGTDVSSLIATYEVRGVEVSVNGNIQVNSITPNNFMGDLIYHLDGYAEQDWTVHVDINTGLGKVLFQKVIMGPNPAPGKFEIRNVADMDVQVINAQGVEFYNSETFGHQKNIQLDNLTSGVYFVVLSKAGKTETRKMIVK
ncbi:MAG: T9SS type A sorting domain-containing protein [Bacteroidales bacterium]|nr:T9SS type A sorting domain-containing protein [Bacteroidales bacterium]